MYTWNKFSTKSIHAFICAIGRMGSTNQSWLWRCKILWFYFKLSRNRTIFITCECFIFQGECANPVLDVPVAETIVHENYVPQSALQNNDIALIRLAQSVQFTDWIRPVCLPFSQTLRNKNYDNAPLVVAGFGKTENGMIISVLMNSWTNHQVFFLTRFSITKWDQIEIGGERF